MIVRFFVAHNNHGASMNLQQIITLIAINMIPPCVVGLITFMWIGPRPCKFALAQRGHANNIIISSMTAVLAVGVGAVILHEMGPSFRWYHLIGTAISAVITWLFAKNALSYVLFAGVILASVYVALTVAWLLCSSTLYYTTATNG